MTDPLALPEGWPQATLRGSFTPWLAVMRVTVWGRVFVQESGATYVQSAYAACRSQTIASSSLVPCSSPSMRVAALRPRRGGACGHGQRLARGTAGHLRDGRCGGCSAGSPIRIDHEPPPGVD